MVANELKTKRIVCGKFSLELNDKNFEKVQSYKYLDNIINSTHLACADKVSNWFCQI